MQCRSSATTCGIPSRRASTCCDIACVIAVSKPVSQLRMTRPCLCVLVNGADVVLSRTSDCMSKPPLTSQAANISDESSCLWESHASGTRGHTGGGTRDTRLTDSKCGGAATSTFHASLNRLVGHGSQCSAFNNSDRAELHGLLRNPGSVTCVDDLVKRSVVRRCQAWHFRAPVAPASRLCKTRAPLPSPASGLRRESKCPWPSAHRALPAASTSGAVHFVDKLTDAAPAFAPCTRAYSASYFGFALCQRRGTCCRRRCALRVMRMRVGARNSHLPNVSCMPFSVPVST